MTLRAAAHRAICVGFVASLLASTDILAFDLPAATLADLQAAAERGNAELAAEARRSAQRFPDLAREIQLEVLALALENAIALNPAALESLLANAQRAAGERNLLRDGSELAELRVRAQAAADRGTVRQRRGIGGVQGQALAVSQNERAALDALADTAMTEMAAAPGRAQAIADEAILIARERALPITPDFVDRLRRRATFLSLQAQGTPAPRQTATATRQQTAQPGPRAPSPQTGTEQQSEDSRGWPTETEDRMRNERSLTSGWLPLAIGGGVLGAGTLVAFAVDGSGDDEAPAPSDFETDEFTGSGYLAEINASNAYARGATGQGQIIAVSSSGVDVEHPELAGRIAAGGVDLVDGDADPNPVGAGGFRSVGTTIASIAAGRRGGPDPNEFPIPFDEEMPPPQTHGVAPDARILPIRREDSNGTNFGSLIDAIDVAIASGADVFYDSIVFEQPLNVTDEDGGRGPFTVLEYSPAEEEAFLRGAAAGMLFVTPTGAFENEAIEASPQALVPQEFAEIEPFYIAVSGSGSNPCGGAANWCLTAPDTDLLAAADLNDTRDQMITGGYTFVSGSRGAAAVVAGATAVLRSMFPELSARDIRTILLLSATDLGEPGIDPTTGHGLLNLERATRPLGENGIELGGTLGEMTVPLADSRITLSAAFGSSVPATLSDSSLAFVDGFDRSYALPLVELSAAARPVGLNSWFDWYGRLPMLDETAPLNASGSAAMSLSLAATDPRKRVVATLSGDRTRRETAWAMQTDVGGLSIAAAQGERTAAALFGMAAHDRDLAALALQEIAFASPYLNLLKEPRGYAASWRLGRGAFRSGFLDGKQGGYAMVSEAVMPLGQGGGLAVIQSGMLRETDRLLDARLTGAFTLAEHSDTWFVGGTGLLPVTPQLDLIAGLHIGRTAAAPGDASLFTRIDPLWSGSAGIGLKASDLLGGDDALLVSVNRPLRIIAGGGELRLPTGRFGTAILSERRPIDFTAAGNPVELSGSYRWHSTFGTVISSGMRLKFGERSDAGPVSGEAVMRVIQSF